MRFSAVPAAATAAMLALTAAAPPAAAQEAQAPESQQAPQAPAPAEADDAAFAERLALASSLYRDVFAEEFARQTAEATSALMRARVQEAAFREGRSLDEAGFAAFSAALAAELREDIDLLAGDWASLMAGGLTLEELQAFRRAYEDPLMRRVLAKVPGIMQGFSASVSRLSQGAIQRTLVTHPPQTLMR